MDIKFDEYGTTLDDPYVVRCAKGFGWWYTDYEDEGNEIDKHFRVEEGTEWDIDSHGDENDVLLYSDEGYIEIAWEDLDAHFELVHEGGYEYED